MGEVSDRKPISKRLRFEVFKRDRFACQYCGAHPPDAVLEIDHLVPVIDGGTDDETNLIAACFNCNRGKSSISLAIAPKSLAEKAQEIEEREAQLSGYRAIAAQRMARIENDAWQVAENLEPNSSTDGIRRDRLRSIKLFNERLPLDQVIEAAEIALARFPFSDYQRFRYFCGVCWKKIKGQVP